MTDNAGITWATILPWVLNFPNEEIGWQKVTECYLSGWDIKYPASFDKSGHLWVFNGNGWEVYYTRYDGESWSKIDTVPTYLSANWNSRITADSSGGVWVGWNTDWWGFWEPAFNKYEDGSWSVPQPVTDTFDLVDNELWSMTTDVNDRVWFAWVNHGEDPKNKPIKAAYYDKGSRSEEMMIFFQEGMVPQDVDLTPDSEGGMWAMWSLRENTLERTPTLIQVSYWDGHSWSAADTVTIITRSFTDILTRPDGKIVVDEYGNAWAVWRQALVEKDEYGDIYYSVNTGNGWSEPAPVNEDPAVDQYPDIAVDGEGRVWCVWVSNREGEDEYDYSIWASYTTSSGVTEEGFIQPPKSRIESISPNPFQTSATIFYSVGSRDGSQGIELVELTVFDVTGRSVKTLVADMKAPGHYKVNWDGRDANGQGCPAGVYFVRMLSDECNSEARLVLLR